MAGMVIICASQDVRALSINRDKDDEFSAELPHHFVSVCQPFTK